MLTAILASIGPVALAAGLAIFVLMLILHVGGSSTSIRTPWPKGDDGVIPLIFSGLSRIAGNPTDFVIASMTMPFSCKCVYAEFIAGSAITDADADTTITVIDDTGTPKVWVAAVAITALAAKARKQFTVVKTVEFYEGAILQILLAVGDDADVFVNGTMVLWVVPTH
jgi:hypothetical protein